MKSNLAKTRTIASFFSSSTAKKQKIYEQEPNASSSLASTKTTKEFIPPETSNVVSSADASSSGHVDSNAIYIPTTSTLLSPKISSLSSASSVLTSSTLSARCLSPYLLPIDTRCSLLSI